MMRICSSKVVSQENYMQPSHYSTSHGTNDDLLVLKDKVSSQFPLTFTKAFLCNSYDIYSTSFTSLNFTVSHSLGSLYNF